ncbi:MAG TPA: thiamine phosphate synthase [Terriglobales bacterium]|nr:thiamine phosphate synthase [Terriglobales bacterium]
MAGCPRLYLVTDRHRTGGRALLDVLAAALQGGVDTVQLREKDLSARALFELGGEVLALCRQHGARLLVNDRIDVALALGADGVQLPQRSFAPQDARALLGPDKWIGCSTHSAAEVQQAFAGGADFVVFGPVYDTESKRRYGPPLGRDALAEVTARRLGPVVAIGGVTAARVAELRDAGAAGVAVIGAVLSAADPAAAARQLIGR